MKQVRSGLYETNSSSTHSVSIGPIKKKKVNGDIPRQSTEVYEVPEYQVANGHEESTIKNTLVSETYKLAFLVNVVATYIEEEYENYDDYIATTFSCLCGRSVEEDNEDDERKAISQDLIYIKWLREMVEEETETKIKFPIPSEKSYESFPYYTTLYTEKYDDFYEEIKKSIEDQDEALFKSLCREIVFNSSIIIEDTDKAYHCDYEENIL